MQKLLFIILLLSVSCGIMFNGTSTTVSLKSSPTGALVKLNGRGIGRTPMIYQLKNEKRGAFSFVKEGYETIFIPIYSSISGIFWVNIIGPGLLGMAVDLISGGAYTIDNPYIEKVLSKIK